MPNVPDQFKTFLNGGSDLSEGRRVLLSSGVLAYAGLNAKAIGTLINNAPANTQATVRLNGPPGTVRVSLSGTCAAGDLLYSAANGQVSTTSTSAGNAIFRALQVGASGEIIEAQPLLAET